MSQDTGTADRTYARLKADLLRGALSVHVRLDFAELAIFYGVSTTPVREAAMRLLGEGLLVSLAKGGVKPAFPSEYRLRALLDLHAKLTLAAVDWGVSPVPNFHPGSTASYEQKARQFFLDLAQTTANDEFVEILDRLSDRLAPFRHCEDEIIDDPAEDIEQLRRQGSDPVLLRRALRAYHRRRMIHVPQLVWAATSNGTRHGPSPQR